MSRGVPAATAGQGWQGCQGLGLAGRSRSPGCGASSVSLHWARTFPVAGPQRETALRTGSGLLWFQLTFLKMPWKPSQYLLTQIWQQAAFTLHHVIHNRHPDNAEHLL